MKTLEYWIDQFEKIEKIIFECNFDKNKQQVFVRTEKQNWQQSTRPLMRCDKIMQDIFMEKIIKREDSVYAMLSGKTFCVSLAYTDIKSIIDAYNDLREDVEDNIHGLPLLDNLYVMRLKLNVTHCIHTQMNIQEKYLYPICDYFFDDDISIPATAEKTKVAKALADTNRFLKNLWPPHEIF